MQSEALLSLIPAAYLSSLTGKQLKRFSLGFLPVTRTTLGLLNWGYTTYSGVTYSVSEVFGPRLFRLLGMKTKLKVTLSGLRLILVTRYDPKLKRQSTLILMVKGPLPSLGTLDALFLKPTSTLRF